MSGTITADRVRELAARTEGADLDFKRDMYDWETDGNVELAKDLMAMANLLRSESEPAYVLIGVDQLEDRTGRIVGVPPASHLDDAALHQKVAGLLNATPVFSYAPTEVDGVSVGVIEIRPGGRPFFPIRDLQPRDNRRQRLTRNLPLYRNGSSSDPATPTMVLEWGRQDDAVTHRLRSMEVAKLEAERLIQAILRPFGGFSFGSEGLQGELAIENYGRTNLVVKAVKVATRWRPEFHELLKSKGLTLPDRYKPPIDDIYIFGNAIIRPGGRQRITWVSKNEKAAQHLASVGVDLPDVSLAAWADYVFIAVCQNDFGDTEEITYTYSYR